MKHSIKKIFKSLNIYLIFISVASLITLLLTVEHGTSIKKIDNLNLQKVLLLNLTQLQKTDIELALIQAKASSSQLIIETQKLSTFYQYNITQKFIINNSNEYARDLKKLNELVGKFNLLANRYYIDCADNNLNKKEDELGLGKLKDSFHYSVQHINSMIFKEFTYNKKIFLIIEKFVFLIFLIIIAATLFYRKKLQQIYADILFLYSVEQGKKNHMIFTEEMDAIALRMKRKTNSTDSPKMTDKVTGLKNFLGLRNSYAEKKNLKDSNVKTVTVLEIDSFSKNNKIYPEEFIQLILKKIAFTLSLYEQAVDTIARTDYNQFVLILSRPTKELAFKDIEMIQESIRELKFSIPDKGIVNITLSGGFMVKPPNMHLDEALKVATIALVHAKENGKDRISKEKEI